MWICFDRIEWIFIEEIAKRKNSSRKTGKSRSEKKNEGKTASNKAKIYLEQVAKVES